MKDIGALWTLDKRQSRTFLTLCATALLWSVTSCVSNNVIFSLLSGVPMLLVLWRITRTAASKKAAEEE